MHLVLPNAVSNNVEPRKKRCDGNQQRVAATTKKSAWRAAQQMPWEWNQSQDLGQNFPKKSGWKWPIWMDFLINHEDIRLSVWLSICCRYYIYPRDLGPPEIFEWKPNGPKPDVHCLKCTARDVEIPLALPRQMFQTFNWKPMNMLRAMTLKLHIVMEH